MPAEHRDRILAVDDSEVNLELLQALLEDDYEIRTALSADACMALLAGGFSPDLFLMDICMPDKDGYQLCGALKAESPWQSIPVLFISALERAEDRLRAYEAGGDDYIMKPVQADQLRDKVNAMLQSRRYQREIEERVREANTTAMEAMMSSCEMGQLIDFMLKASAAPSIIGLLDHARQLLEGWGLASAFLFVGGGEAQVLSGCAPGSLEARILSDSRGDGVTEFRQRLLMDRGDFRLLVKNMPLEQPERYDRIKDHLAVLGNIIKTRLQSLLLKSDMKRQRDNFLDQVIKRSEIQLDAVRENVKEQSQASVDAFRVMLLRLEERMFHLGLEEDQEQALRSLVDEAGGSVTELVRVSEQVQKSVDNVIHDLYMLAQRDA